jgi:hypothetical protein
MFPLDGATTLSPRVPTEKEGRQMRWPMLKPWVTEESAIIETLETLVASGVPTKNDCPYPTLAGAELIVGREPWNR